MGVMTADEYLTPTDTKFRTIAPEVGNSEWFVPDFNMETGTRDEESDTASMSDGGLTSQRRVSALVVPSPISGAPKPIVLPDYRIKLLQQWECIVLNVCDDYVACEMHDLTDESQPEEYAEVYVNEFNLFDRPLLKEGAVFYWSVGQEIKRSGNVRKYSELRVRRMPSLSKSKLRELNRRAEHLSKLFGSRETLPAAESNTT